MGNRYSGSQSGQEGVRFLESDGNPDAHGVSEVRVTNGSLTALGNGVVELTTGGGGGGIGGTITSEQVAYGTANDTIGGDGNFTWDSTKELLTVSYGKIKNIYEVFADVDIDKGEVVYVTGYDSGSGKPTVALAKADDSATMPSIGLATANISSGQQGFVIFSGQINGVDTTGTTTNDTLYVSATTAGELTKIKPTGATEQIQNVGRVVQVGASGKIAVSNIGRTNDVPNTISITGDLTVSGEGQIKKANVITLGATSISFATHAGAYLNVSNNPIQLPAISSIGEKYILVNNSGGALTISATGGDTIIGSTSLSDQTAVTVFALTTSQWFVIS